MKTKDASEWMRLFCLGTYLFRAGTYLFLSGDVSLARKIRPQREKDTSPNAKDTSLKRFSVFLRGTALDFVKGFGKVEAVVEADGVCDCRDG